MSYIEACLSCGEQFKPWASSWEGETSGLDCLPCYRRKNAEYTDATPKVVPFQVRRDDGVRHASRLGENDTV
jgi:hypothetical protein